MQGTLAALGSRCEHSGSCKAAWLTPAIACQPRMAGAATALGAAMQARQEGSRQPSSGEWVTAHTGKLDTASYPAACSFIRNTKELRPSAQRSNYRLAG